MNRFGILVVSEPPNFRGKDGFLTLGSKKYKPEEMGTFEMFLEKSIEVWKMFINLRTIFEKANSFE